MTFNNSSDSYADETDNKPKCPCCNGTGEYDEGYGSEECSACKGTGVED